MGKIINKILERRQQHKTLLERGEIDEEAKYLSGFYYSFEFFPPKTEAGLDNLLWRIERMTQRLDPLYLNVTWGSSGSTAVQSMAIASHAQKFLGVDALLHITAQGMPASELRRFLHQAKTSGIQNLLVLRGDPPPGKSSWLPGDVSGGDCPRAIDFLKLIRQEYGDFFGIAVAGHPEGHPSSTSVQEEIRHLKEKLEAGAEFIITQFFYDVDKFLSYVKLCRDNGITCPIVPGIMPIQSYNSFIRMTDFCNVSAPQDLRNRLAKVKDDDEAVKEIGCQVAVDMCWRILRESNGQIDGVHFYTLNLERSVTRILWQLKVVDSIDADPQSVEFSEEQPPARNRSPSLSETVVRSRTGRIFPWRPSAMQGRSQTELVRPINWANRPKSYVMRTEDWDEFPNGRWGDASSPAFGEWSNLGHFYASTGAVVSDDERRDILGYAPQSPQEIWETFARFVEGKIHFLPWCETTKLQPESSVIASHLAELNRSGFLTINSQPAINGIPSGDKIVGWGGRNGYLYQKAYCECFCSPKHLDVLRAMVRTHRTMNLYAVNIEGREKIQEGHFEPGVTALTWGVFPNREILQPTIFDPGTFFTVWAEEAFSLWTSMWLNLYDFESDSYQLVEQIRDTYFLCAIIDNDFYRTGNDNDLFTEMLKSAETWLPKP